jgi:hypothetical protein
MLRAIAALLSSGWPIAGVAQMVAPTPQPPGAPVTPEQAAEVEIQNWAVHGQSTFTQPSTSPKRSRSARGLIEEVRFAMDSPLEEDGFELSVPR